MLLLVAFLAINAAPRTSPAATVESLFLAGQTNTAGTVLRRFHGISATSARKVAFFGGTAAVLVKSGGVFTTVVQLGDAAPTLFAGATFASRFQHPRINAAGDIAFISGTTVGGSQLFFTSGGTVTNINISVGDPPDIDGAGNVLYVSSGELYLWNRAGMTSAVIVPDGTPIPAGGTISQVGRSPVINDSDVAAFEAEAGGGGDDGIFTWNSIDGLRAVAQTGQATPLGGTYRPFNAQRAVAINASNKVAFTSRINGGGASEAVFLGDPNGAVVTAVAKVGDLVGAEALTDIDDEFVGANATDVAFIGTVASGRKLIRVSGGILTALTDLDASDHDFSPHLTPGGRIVWRHGNDVVEYDGSRTTVISPADTTPVGTHLAAGEPSVNDSNVVAFPVERTQLHLLASGAATPIAEIGDPSPGSGTFSFVALATLGRSLFFYGVDAVGGLIVESDDGVLSRVLGDGDATPLGGTLTIEDFDVHGRLVPFTATVTGGSAAAAVFRLNARTGTISTLVQSGTAAPSGALFESFGVIRALGRKSVFGASLDDSTEGLFVTDPRGQVTAIARTGDVAPDAGGSTFSDFIGDPAAHRGRVVFVATLQGGSVTGDGLFLWQRGVVSKIAVPGDPAPGGGMIISLSGGYAVSGSNISFLAVTDNAGFALLLSQNGVLTTVVPQGSATPAGGTFGYVGGVGGLVAAGQISQSGRTTVFDAIVEGGTAPLGIFSAKP